MELRIRGDTDALILGGSELSLDRMKRAAFINAAINNVPAVLRRIAPSYSGIDVIGLAERLRLEVVMRRLE